MPRKDRVDAPGALHHIIIRGIERKPIFKDKIDYGNFIDRLGKILLDTGTACFAWALITNHAHFLFRTGMVSISHVMRRLLTGYAQQFNRRHQRHGHLFQNRYKSILCEEAPYLLELVRYIHLNPIRAGIIKDLKDLDLYPRCGHSTIMGKIKREWQETEYVLKFFGPSTRKARKAYVDFVSKGVRMGHRSELVGGGLLRSAGGWSALKAIRNSGMRIMGDERILGGNDFVESVLEKANEEYEKRTIATAKGFSLEKVLDIVAGYFDLDSNILTLPGRGRKVSRARSIFCVLAIDLFGYSGAEVARALSLTPSAVSKSVVKGREDELTGVIENDLMTLLERQK